MGNFIPLSGNRKIPARRSRGLNLGPQAQNGRTLGSRPPPPHKLIHDISLAGHPGREKTLAAARRKYYWPTLRVDVESLVARCISCAQHKETLKGPAPMLQYPLPESPWDIVSIDLLQLSQSQYGSRYLLVCVDHLTRYVVLAPLKDKTATQVAHALVTHLFCPFVLFPLHASY